MRKHFLWCVCASAVVAALLGSGCRLNPAIFGSSDGPVPLANNYFVIEINPARVSELGGPSSPGLKSYVDEELARKGMCNSGYTIVSETVNKGFYLVKGQCKR